MWLNHLKGKNAQPGWQYMMWRDEVVDNVQFDHNIHRAKRRAFGLDDYDNHTEHSDWGDVVSPKGYHFALRYKYSQNDSTTESKSGVSREFCQEMVDLSKSGVMYRYEDIADMSDDGINGQFAAAGESTYDIFLHKGGINCYHSWHRVIYIYAPNGEVDTQGLEEVLSSEWDAAMRKVGNNPYVQPLGDEAYRPIDGQTNAR